MGGSASSVPVDDPDDQDDLGVQVVAEERPHRAYAAGAVAVVTRASTVASIGASPNRAAKAAVSSSTRAGSASGARDRMKSAMGKPWSRPVATPRALSEVARFDTISVRT